MTDWTTVASPILLGDHSDRHETGGADEVYFNLDEITSDTTLTSAYQVILVDTSGGNVTLILPAAADNEKREYYIKNISTGVVTIDGNDAEKVEWEETLKLKLQGDSVHIICAGTVEAWQSEWYIIGGRNVKLEDLIKTIGDDQIDLLRQILEETKQNQLHLEDGSGEHYTEEDVKEREWQGGS